MPSNQELIDALQEATRTKERKDLYSRVKDLVIIARESEVDSIEEIKAKLTSWLDSADF